MNETIWLAQDNNGVVSAPTMHANAAVVFSSASMILCFFVVVLRFLAKNKTPAKAYYSMVKWLAAIIVIASFGVSISYFALYPWYLFHIIEPCHEIGKPQLCSMSVVVFWLFIATLLMTYIALAFGTKYGAWLLLPCACACPSACGTFILAEDADDMEDDDTFGDRNDGDPLITTTDPLAKQEVEARANMQLYLKGNTTTTTRAPRYANKLVRRSYHSVYNNDDEDEEMMRPVQTRRSSVYR